MATAVTVRVIHPFYDKTDGLKLKQAGEEMNVDPDRAEKLISLGLVVKIDPGIPEAAADKE